MHEAGIADRILDIVVARAHEAGAPRITAIHLEAGALAAVSEDSLRFHWEQHAAGTPAEGAVLHFTEVDTPTDLRLVAIDVADDEPADEHGRPPDDDPAHPPAEPGGPPAVH